MENLRKTIIMVGLIIFGLPFITFSNSAFADQQLVFGLYSSDKPTEMIKQFRPILNILEAKASSLLGESIKIRIKVSKSYEEGIAALVNGDVDFSRFGPASYITAKQSQPDLSILAMETSKGKKSFNGIIAVAADSPIRAVEELHGKTFAFGNESSTIGRYLSQLFLSERGVFSSSLEKYDYLDRHDRVGTAVAAGKYDAGALKESTFKSLNAKGHALKAIATFENVTKPWIGRAGLPERTAKALTGALLDVTDENALKALKKDGFAVGTDADYERIRQSITRNDTFFK